MNFTAGELAAFFTGLTGLIGSGIAIRRLRFEGRDQIIKSFTTLITEQRTELTLAKVTITEQKLQFDAQIARLNEEIQKSRKDRAQELSDMARAHSIEIDRIRDEYLEENDKIRKENQEQTNTLIEKSNQQQITINRQMTRIRALENQLGIGGGT